MRPNLTHIALHVINFDECVEFYKNYCQLKTIHHRETKKTRIVWLAEQGRETDLIFVLISGGINRDPGERDFGHLGFAVDSKQTVDEIAKKAQREGNLVWPPRQEPYPVGYYCGVRDPDGAHVEFSYGQPLGPGAKQVYHELESEQL